jgi:hypothetical protein
MQQVSETAVVVGPAGEEIYTDAHGRIKVQFHWDREGRHDDHSSCWMRVVQPWAGSNWGVQFIPRIGMEVVVTFSGGDTDAPLVTGAVYNATHPPPFALPEHKTQSGLRSRSSPGGSGSNELRFEDAAGAEEIFVHAQKDLREVVRNDHALAVGRDEAVQITGNRSTLIEGNHVRVIKGSEVATIEGNMVLHVVGKQHIKVDAKGGDTGGASDASGTSTGAPGGESAPSPAEALAGALAAGAAPPALVPERRRALLADFSSQLAQLPAEQSATGAELQRIAEQGLDLADALRTQVNSVRDMARQAQAQPELGGDMLERALRAFEQARTTQMDLAQLYATVMATDCHSDAARDAATAIVKDLILEAAMRAGEIERLCSGLRAFGAGGASGAFFGGGGAPGDTTEFQDIPITFKKLGKDGKPTTVTKPGGMAVEVEGPSSLTVKDGYQIEAGGCTVDMVDGQCTITGAIVTVKGLIFLN